MPDEMKINKQALHCAAPDCNEPIDQAQLYLDAEVGPARIHYVCQAGHTSQMLLSVQGVELVEPEPVSAGSTIRTKVSGVTFENQDGTKRQALLRHVKPDDALQIVKGQIDGKTLYLVKHDLGILGSVRRDVLVGTDGESPTLPIPAKVVQVTGGTEGKTTLGCNIEMTRPSLPSRQPAPPGGGNVSPSRKPGRVFMESGSRKIYHMDPHCSGLKHPEPQSVKYARDVLHARPCKKCCGTHNDMSRGD